MKTDAAVISQQRSAAELREDETLRGRLLAALPYLLITAAVLLAWFPAITRYIGVNDDYLDFIILRRGWAGWFEVWGIWRIWGIPLAIWSIDWHPLAPVLLGLLAHLLSLYFFYRVCELFFGGGMLALTLTLLAGVFPWGFEAVLWSAAQSPVLAHPLFWANILLLFWYARKGTHRQTAAFVISYLLTLVGALGNDYLIFSCMLSGALVWIPEDGFGWREIKGRMLSFYSGWAPLLASLTYIFMYRLWSAGVVNDYKHPFFNFRSILSTYYYQYTNAWIFQPWLNSQTRRLTFFSWGWPQIFAALLLMIVVAGLLLLMFSKYPDHERNEVGATNGLLVYIMLLLFGGSLVYAFNGGYSLDSRKKYPLIPLILLLAGWLWRRYVPRGSRQTALAGGALAGLMLAGVTTTWLVIGVWRYEVTRYSALIDYVSSRHLAGRVRLVSEPDIYAAWPKLIDVIGFRLDDPWVINNALEYKEASLIEISEESSARVLYFDANEMRWEESPR